MTDLGPDFVRAKQKGKSGTVIVHRSQLGELYIAEPLTKDEQAAAVAAGPDALTASSHAREEADRMADDERAALAKRAAEARAVYEAASLERRDAAAQRALDQGEIQAAAALAAAKVTDQKAAARKKAGLAPERPVAADGRSPGDIDPATVRVGTESAGTMAPDKSPTSGETDRRLEREALALEEQGPSARMNKEGHVGHPTHPNVAPEKSGKK